MKLLLASVLIIGFFGTVLGVFAVFADLFWFAFTSSWLIGSGVSSLYALLGIIFFGIFVCFFFAFLYEATNE